MNNLKIFENAEFGQIRTAEVDGEPWFVGKDVAEALGYAEPRSAVSKKVEEVDRGVVYEKVFSFAYSKGKIKMSLRL